MVDLVEWICYAVCAVVVVIVTLNGIDRLREEDTNETED